MYGSEKSGAAWPTLIDGGGGGGCGAGACAIPVISIVATAIATSRPPCILLIDPPLSLDPTMLFRSRLECFVSERKLLARAFGARDRFLQIFLVQLDPDEVDPQPRAGHGRAAKPQERIDHQPGALQSMQPQTLLW